MTDFTPTPEAVEAAARQLAPRAAIRAFLEAEGFEVERSTKRFKPDINEPDEQRVRLISQWRPDD